MMAYAASVGSEAAKQECGAVGFIGNATDATSHYFGNQRGYGTMPHAFIGYAGSTLRAAEMYHDVFEGEPMTVLVDYYGQEITDTLAVCRRFPELAARGELSMRLDTHGSRYVEGLDMAESYDVLERYSPNAVREYRTEAELRWLNGTGVSAAALFHLRAAPRRCRLREGEDRCELRLRPGQVQGHGQRERADRRDRHGLVSARELVGDLRDGRCDRVRWHLTGQARPRVSVAEWRRRLSPFTIGHAGGRQRLRRCSPDHDRYARHRARPAQSHRGGFGGQSGADPARARPRPLLRVRTSWSAPSSS